MPRTRPVDPVLPGVTVSGRSPLGPERAVAVAEAVLRRERCSAAISLGFVGRDRMRALNRRFRGADRVTDVLAFSLRGPGDLLVGDVYVCPWVATREAGRQGISAQEEIIRCVVHGVLHVLGYDHPPGASRVRSAMWRRQERYVKALG